MSQPDRNSIIARVCPEHGAGGMEHIVPCECGHPMRENVKRTYVAVDALLSDEFAETVERCRAGWGAGDDDYNRKAMRQAMREALTNRVLKTGNEASS